MQLVFAGIQEQLQSPDAAAFAALDLTQLFFDKLKQGIADDFYIPSPVSAPLFK
jgi:hypothetical protein